MSERTYSTREAAELLGIKPNSLINAMHDGRIKPVSPGASRFLFTREEVERYDAYRKTSRGGDMRSVEARGVAGRAVRSESYKPTIHDNRPLLSMSIKGDSAADVQRLRRMLADCWNINPAASMQYVQEVWR